MSVPSLLWTDAATVSPWQEVSRALAYRAARSGASLPKIGPPAVTGRKNGAAGQRGFLTGQTGKGVR